MSLCRSHCHMRKVVNPTYHARFKWKNPTGGGSLVPVTQGCRSYTNEASNCETQASWWQEEARLCVSASGRRTANCWARLWCWPTYSMTHECGIRVSRLSLEKNQMELNFHATATSWSPPMRWTPELVFRVNMMVRRTGSLTFLFCLYLCNIQGLSRKKNRAIVKVAKMVTCLGSFWTALVYTTCRWLINARCV